MPIVPLPQFEADLAAYTDEQDRLARERLTPPKTVVCRFGAMRLIGEFRYTLDVTPGCGSQLIVRTFRGTELGEMLTSTCPNSGCGKSISRQEMLRYIEASGGKDYPFYEKGRVLRVATPEDLHTQSACVQAAHEMKRHARAIAQGLNLDIRVVEAESILGGELRTYYYLVEQGEGAPGQGKAPARRGPDPRLQAGRLRDALQREAPEGCRVEVRPVGARDEARLTADYERCGQHCCCKNFLKVLKPVPMRAAKQQKATLDPLKISGRCGRLMCCLRYEDESYRELAARLPHRKTRVGTSEGVGEVVDTQILTQLVLVRLEFDGREIAVAVEDLIDPSEAPERRPAEPRRKTDAGGAPKADPAASTEASLASDGLVRKKKRRKKKPPPDGAKGEQHIAKEPAPGDGQGAPARKKKRRRRKRRPGDGANGQEGGGASPA